MKIYLIRHSNAVDPGSPDYDDDSQRPLTEKGSEKARRIARALKKMNINPDYIVSSPYVRARQTAEILAKEMKYKQVLALSNQLVPMGEAEEIVREINEKYNVDELVFVSHEPCISGLIGALTADNPEISTNIKNGGVCCLSADDLRLEHKAVLEWLLTPKILSLIS